jgi:hypothetical protein
MVFSSFLMVANNSIMAHCDAVNKGEETISSTYKFQIILSRLRGAPTDDCNEGWNIIAPAPD